MRYKQNEITNNSGVINQAEMGPYFYEFFDIKP